MPGDANAYPTYGVVDPAVTPGNTTLSNSTQYHQQCQNHHCANAHRCHIPAQVSVLAEQQATASEAGKDCRNVHQCIERIALKQPGHAEERFNEHAII